MNSKLRLDDDSMVEVMGIEKVKIKTVDGIVYTLEDVAYVPKIWKDSILLSLLDYQDYDYEDGGGVLKETKDYIIMKKEKLHQGLYRLKESIVKTSKG